MTALRSSSPPAPGGGQSGTETAVGGAVLRDAVGASDRRWRNERVAQDRSAGHGRTAVGARPIDPYTRERPEGDDKARDDAPAFLDEHPVRRAPGLGQATNRALDLPECWRWASPAVWVISWLAL
jgi:hypothetical protein